MATYANALPQSYTTPSFPSLYWPFQATAGEAKYLDDVSTVWRFTTYWTLISVCSAHFLVAVWAILMQFLSAYRRHNYINDPRVSRTLSAKNKKLLGESPLKDTAKYVGVVLAVYMVIGAIEAFVAGSLVGLILGALYDAGFFRMSTWTPFIWSIINMLVLIVASFRIQGGL